MNVLDITADRATAAQLGAHLWACDASFTPRLSSRVDIDAYAAKLVDRAHRCEAWDADALVGVVAVYLNGDAGYITNVSVLPGWHGRRIATVLLERATAAVHAAGLARVDLEVDPTNAPATALYRSAGFTPGDDGRWTKPLNEEIEGM